MAVWNDQCGTCIRKNRCMERSRLQACRGYIKRTQAAATAEGPVTKIVHPHYTEGEGEMQDGNEN